LVTLGRQVVALRAGYLASLAIDADGRIGVEPHGLGHGASDPFSISRAFLNRLIHIAAAHDSWVVGDEPYVSLHFLGADQYGR
jgi:hypothetical protein